MPIGGLFQRVSKLVHHQSAGKNSNSNADVDGAIEEGQRNKARSSASSSSSAAASPASSRRQSRHVADKQPALPSVSSDVGTNSSTASLQAKGDSETLAAQRRKIPSISTSSAHLQQPTLSVTPATPITPTSSSALGQEKEGQQQEHQGGGGGGGGGGEGSASSAEESLKRVQSTQVQNDGTTEKDRRTSSSNQSSSPPVRRIPSQPILNAADNQSSALKQQQELEDSDSKGLTGVVLAEPMQMSEEEELRLMKEEEKQRLKAKEEHKKHLQEGQQDPAEREDNPNMPPPPLPSAPRHPHLERALEHVNVPKKPSILARLPSQVISESPGSEYPPSPSGSDAAPSRQSSMRSTGLQSMTSKLTEASLSGHKTYKREVKDGDAADEKEDRSHQQRHHHHPHHLPGLLANAVHDLHNKLAKPSGDYHFPDTPAASGFTTAQEPIKEEDSFKSPRSERENTFDSVNSSSNYSSPPSSAFLDPSHRTLSPRESRDPSSTSSLSSINEFSTPAGFLKHRRSSSQNAPREVKETYNAGYKDLPDGKRKLNQYILTGDIGRGSFGLVQIAKDEQSGQEYAVKEFSKMRLRKRQQSEMIRRQAKGSRRGAVPIRGKQESQRTASSSLENAKKDLDLIRSEVAIMKKLDHPNVVKLYEVLDVEQDDSLFMVVELCKNGPIMNISMGQSTDPMSEDTARNFFRQMLLAIEYLHENGIIHRDIKPENILKMSDDMSIKLVDFGVSEMFSREEDEQRELRTGGSPAFMAPELCMAGHTKVSGKAADIWALGITLYCMVVGHLPFESTLMLDLYDKIKNDPVNMPENLSVSLRELIITMLEKNPTKRIRMPQLREHRWVTCDGRDPLPSTEMNVTNVEEVTEKDIDNAIAVPSVSYIVNAVRAANRWRRFAARRTQSEGAQSTDGASSMSTDMSRSGSFEGAAGGPSRKSSASNAAGPQLVYRLSPEATGLASDGGSAMASGKVIQESAIADDGTGASTSRTVGASQSLTPSASQTVIGDAVFAEPEEDDNLDSRNDKKDATELKTASSYPLYLEKSTSKRPPYQPSEASGGSRRSIKTSIDSMVDFPEIDRAASQQEYLRETGIDDSSVEVLRHYEEVTGHMLQRSAVEEVVRSRKNSPLPQSDTPQHAKPGSQ